MEGSHYISDVVWLVLLPSFIDRGSIRGPLTLEN